MDGTCNSAVQRTSSCLAWVDFSWVVATSGTYLLPCSWLVGAASIPPAWSGAYRKLVRRWRYVEIVATLCSVYPSCKPAKQHLSADSRCTGRLACMA